MCCEVLGKTYPKSIMSPDPIWSSLTSTYMIYITRCL